jgi:hypothetical protein
MTHVVVWIDHKEARIFHVHPEAADESRILSPQHQIHRHPKGRGEPREHPDDAQQFFDEVARGLDGVDSVLIVGPASAKQNSSSSCTRITDLLYPRSQASRQRIIRRVERSSPAQEAISR